MLSWDVHQLPRHPFQLFDANIFHPLRHTLAYSEALLSEAVLVLPLAPFAPAPVLLNEVALLLSFVVGATGAFLLVRRLTGDALAAFVGGLLFAFAPYRFWQIDRLHALSVHWTPFLFLALHAWLERGGARHALALAAAFVLQALASVYVAYASVILLAVFLVGWLWIGARQRVLGAVGILAAAAGIVALVYLPYVLARDEMAIARDPVQVIVHSVVPAELGRALVTLPRYLAAKMVAGQRGGGTLGLTAGLLLVLGVVRGAPVARLYAVLALAALLFSFGPVVVLPWTHAAWVPGPYALFHAWAPGFAALREPRRWTGMLVACGSIAAGLGAARLLAAVGRRARLPLTAAIAAAIAVEVGWQPLALEQAPAPGPRAPLYDAIARDPREGAVAELPIGAEHEEAIATFRSAWHFRPLLNGYSAFRPTTADLRRRLRRFPSARTVDLLRRLGVRFVLYDTERRGARPARTLARRLRRADSTADVRAVVGGVALIELVPLSPARHRLGTEIPRIRWRVSASSPGADAAIDGDLATHWTAPVDPAAGGGWLEVDLGEEASFDVVVIELDGHYGEYPRAWRLIARNGRHEWPVASQRYAPAPLVSYRANPGRVVVELPLPPTRARAIRIAVPPLRLPSRPAPFDVPVEYWNWRRWGIHELRLYGRAP